MAIKKEFYYKSKDGENKIHAVTWTPENGSIRGILQIVHGMAEYVERYEDFALYLAEQGFLVVGEDHLGHGKTAPDMDKLGYFTKKSPATIVVKDIHSLRLHIQKLYPHVPYFFLGHSMGSYITRKYLACYGKGIDGAIICGTGWQNTVETTAGILLARFIGYIKGDDYRSKLITKIAFGKYLDQVKEPRTANDWICANSEVVDKYEADDLCGFTFTLNGYRTLFMLVRYACNSMKIKKTPDISLFFIAGSEDPVGQYGKGVMLTYDMYNKLEFSDLSAKLYPGMRHEILNEIEKDKVYEDVLNWIEARI